VLIYSLIYGKRGASMSRYGLFVDAFTFLVLLKEIQGF